MLRGALAAAMVLMASWSPAYAQMPSQASAWPTPAWQSAPLPASVDRAASDLAITEAFAGPHPLLGETRAVIVVQGGRIVFERYGDGYDAETRFVSGAMAQSFTHALVGAAVREGRVAVDAPMGSPHWSAGDRRSSITWRQWLAMVDGQAEVDVADMLYGRGRADIARYAASLPLIRGPGVQARDNAAGAVLIADALTRTIVPDPRNAHDRRARMRAWMQSALFERIGMHPVVEFDPSGLYYGSALIWASARDYARFGYLYLRDGVWGGARVLPSGWVDFARTSGAQWRMGRHMFYARGEAGQLIAIAPGKDLVLVRFGRFDGGDANWAALEDWTQRMVGAFGDRETGDER